MRKRKNDREPGPARHLRSSLLRQKALDVTGRLVIASAQLSFGWAPVGAFLFPMFRHKKQKLCGVPQTLVILAGISRAGDLGDKGAVAAKAD